MPDKQFLKDLAAGEILPNTFYWPQLDAILGTDKRHPFAVRDTTQLWKRAAQWMYCNPDEAWAPETETLFRLDFEANAADGRTRVQNRLMQTWTRYGTYTPCKEDQELIVAELKDLAGLQLLQFAFNAAEWVSPSQKEAWAKQSEAEVRRRPTPTPESMYVYLHGDISLLSPAQKQDANRHLRGETEDYPIGFAQARIVAQSHPEPEVWTACMMDQAWLIAKYPVPDDLWPNAYEAIGQLDAMLDTMPWDQCTAENTRCLITAALMEREGNLLNLDMSAWQRRCPVAWEHTKNMLSVIECLHNIPAGPHDSAVAVNLLVPIMLEEHRKLQDKPPAPMVVDSSVFFGLDESKP